MEEKKIDFKLTHLFSFDILKYDEAMNMFMEGYKLEVNLCDYHIVYIESMIKRIGKKDKDFCKCKLSSGKVFYPNYEFSVFKGMHNDFLINYYQAVGYIPMPEEN